MTKRGRLASPVLVSDLLLNVFLQLNAFVGTATRRSPRKAERKPVYVLNLTIPPQHIDNRLEPAKAAVQLQVYSIHFLAADTP